MKETLLALWDVFANMWGLSFCVDILLGFLFVKKFILKVKATEGEYLPNERNDDMGTHSSFIVPLMLFFMLPFYRPFFFWTYGRKVHRLYGVGKVWISDLIGILFPIVAFMVACVLRIYEVALSEVLVLPGVIAETLAFFLLNFWMKKKYYIPVLPKDEN